MDKLEFTDWSEDHRRFEPGEIAIFRQRMMIMPNLKIWSKQYNINLSSHSAYIGIQLNLERLYSSSVMEISNFQKSVRSENLWGQKKCRSKKNLVRKKSFGSASVKKNLVVINCGPKNIYIKLSSQDICHCIHP